MLCLKEQKRLANKQRQCANELKTARKMLSKKRAKFPKESDSTSCPSDFETKDTLSDSNFCPPEEKKSENEMMMPIQSKPGN